MPVEPEPTPKKTKPSAKTSGEQHEHPLRVHAQALEEELFLPLRRLLLRAAVAGYGRQRASILRRAALAVLRTSCHCGPLLRFGIGSCRRRSSRALAPASRRRRRPLRDPRPDGKGSPRATRPPGRRACRRSGYPPGRRSAGRGRRRASRARSASAAEQRVRPALAAARGVDRCPQLLEHVERRRRRGRVGAEPDASPRRRAVARAERCRSRAARSTAGSARRARRARRAGRAPSASTSTQCAQRRSGAEHGLEARDGALARRRLRGARAIALERAACRARATRSRCALSARCVPTGIPSERHQRVDLERAACTGRAARRRSRTRPFSLTVARFSSNWRRPRRGLAAEDLEVDDRPQAELCGGGGRGAREAVVGGGRDARGERVGGAAARDREHVVAGRAGSCARMCVASQGPNGVAVAEAGVDRVLEVRVRVDEARDDHGVGVVAFGAAGRDLDDLAVLEATRPSAIGGPATGSTQSARDRRVTSCRLRRWRALRAGRAGPRARSRARRG